MKEEFKVALETKRKIDRSGKGEKLKEAARLLFDLFEACKDVDVALVLLPQLDIEVKKLKDKVAEITIQKNVDALFQEIEQEATELADELVDDVEIIDLIERTKEYESKFQFVDKDGEEIDIEKIWEELENENKTLFS